MNIHPLCLFGALLLGLCSRVCPAEPKPELPNIVFILADDLGYGDLGCYGQATLETPRLDRMAAEGMRFTRHYAGSTVCAPSRCVLLTGKHCGHTAVRTNWDPPLATNTPTVASLLRGQGYKTGCFGKWGVGDVIPEDDPNEKGFDEFYGYVDMFHAHNFFPPFLVHNGVREKLRNQLIPGSDKGRGRGNGVAQEPLDYGPQLIVDKALAFLTENAQETFFLYLPLNTPHANNEGGGYDRGMEVPDFGEFTNTDWPKAEKGFARMISDIDRDVGRVLDRLTELGIADDTIVIFSSDNGPHQEGGHKVDAFDSNGLLRGHKRDLYEGGVRVPTIVRWPSRISAGTETAQLSGFQDWLPTLGELAKATVPESDGISLVKTLFEQPNAPSHDYLYWEFYEGGGKQAVVDPRWKAVRLNWNRNPDAPIELFDLHADLGEASNIADEHPQVVEQMVKRMRLAHVQHQGLTQRPSN